MYLIFGHNCAVHGLLGPVFCLPSACESLASYHHLTPHPATEDHYHLKYLIHTNEIFIRWICGYV